MAAGRPPRNAVPPLRRARRSAAMAAAALLLGAMLVAQDPAPATPSPHERAFAAERQGRWADAADGFLALRAGEPHNAEWVIHAGKCLARAARYREAIELLDAARRDFAGVDEIPAALAFALLLQAENDPDLMHPEIPLADAAEIAQQVLARLPDDEDTRLVLAQTLYLQGHREEARAQAEEAARRHPQRAGAPTILGRIALDALRGRLAAAAAGQPLDDDLDNATLAEQARAAFAKAAAADPTRAHPHVALGELAWLLDQPDEARHHLQEALARDPEVRVDHAKLVGGLDLAARRDWYAATRARYEALPDHQPAKAATLRFYEGVASYQLGDWRAAADSFAVAVRDNPAASNSLYYLAMSAYNLGDQDAAEEHAAAYAAISAPGFADVIRALSGDQRGAVGAVVRFLGDRAYQGGRIARSRDLNHVTACLMDTADAWNNYAFLCRETGRFDEALTAYEYALQKEPDSPQLLNDTGVVLHRHLGSPQQLDRARLLYQRAIAAADKVLAARDTSAAARDQANTAKANAEANLRDLAK